MFNEEDCCPIDTEEMIEIVIEVKAGYKISTAEAEKYANKYVDAFIGSYTKITQAGKKKLKEANVLEQSHLSMKRINNTLQLHANEVEAARKLIAAHRYRQKQQRTSK